MQFEFDSAKDDANRLKHGLALCDARELDWDGAVITPDNRAYHGEPRLRAYRMLRGRLHMAAFTLRGEALRVISLRRANQREIIRYEQANPV